MLLYRYFDDKKFAQDFMNSIFRILPLKSYQNIEKESQRDPNDGITEIAIGADETNIYTNYFAETEGNTNPEGVEMKIQRGNSVSWQWHALCFSLQCSQYLSNKFNAKYAVGVNSNELLAFFQAEVFWKRIKNYSCNSIFYCDNKSFLDKKLVEFFRRPTGQIDLGEYLFYRDCFVKNEIYSDEHEYRFLFIIPGNEDDSAPIESPYYFNNQRRMQTAILIEF